MGLFGDIIGGVGDIVTGVEDVVVEVVDDIFGQIAYTQVGCLSH